MAMGKKEVVFTVDLEAWNHALHVDDGGYRGIESIDRLFGLLNLHKIKATVYVLGRFRIENPLLVKEIESQGHVMKEHGIYHDRGEISDRNPYAWLGFTGGFWFRLFPYWFVKWCILRRGECYFHPHDLDENHPKLKHPWFNWKRHVGLKNARRKLERLLSDQDIKWVTA